MVTVAHTTRSSSADWRFESRLPWPGVRGQRIWNHATAAAGDSSGSGSRCGGGLVDTADPLAATNDHGTSPHPVIAEPRSNFRYEVEMCETTAGHVALVLLRRQDKTSSVSSSSSSSPSPTDSAAQLAIPRVLYVVDAVPPKTAGGAAARKRPSATSSAMSLKLNATSGPKWAMLSTRAHSFSESTAPSSATASTSGYSDDASLLFNSVHSQQQEADELELIDELFTTSKATKDACLLVKPPMLCARFDCRLIAVSFTQGAAAATSSSHRHASTGSASTLRCVVAREDGMCYIWEWGADLHQWSFLNRFCFLENPNLKWTRPVRLFATTPCSVWSHNNNSNTNNSNINSGNSNTISGTTTSNSSDDIETTELAWWSAETKSEPKLFVRKIQFGIEKSTFRTEIVIGSAFEVACGPTDVTALLSSSCGLWIVSRSDGVWLRSVSSLRTLRLDWPAILQCDDNNDKDKMTTTTDEQDVLTCTHTVTGELLVLHRPSSRVFVVTVHNQPAATSASCSGDLQLRSKKLLTLTHLAASNSHDNDVSESITTALAAEQIAVHRQLLLALLDQRVVVYSLVSGDPLVSLAFPTAHLAMETPLSLWTSSGGRRGASSVGVFGASGYWRLQAPSAHALADALQRPLSSSSTAHALKAVAPYDVTLEFDAARFALDLLQSARGLVGPTKASAWEAAIRRLSSPALLLATLCSSSASTPPSAKLLQDMGELVAAIYRVTHEILVTGRFGAAVDKRDDAVLLHGLPFVTNANIESLHHLANWVLLAKRKLARLQGAVVHKGTRHLRARTVSAVTTFTEDGDGDDGDANDGSRSSDVATVMPTLTPLQVDPGYEDEDEVDDDVASSRLSRKLRPMTSLQFAAGSCSVRHGKQWLEQLEQLLLSPPRTPSSLKGTKPPPHALLFHQERCLADFQVALSSFSKHMYFESIARLHLLHDPKALVAFVGRVAQFAPRLFSLSGAQRIVRTHAERALMLLPPAHSLVERVRHEQRQRQRAHQESQASQVSSMGTLSSRRSKRNKTDGSLECSAHDTLLAYVDLLCLCGCDLEACRVLLDADLYDDCMTQLTRIAQQQQSQRQEQQDDDDEEEVNRIDRERVAGSVFFLMLEYCVANRDASELDTLLQRKPRHVDVLLVLQALKQFLPLKMVVASSTEAAAGSSSTVSVGALRKVLLKLLLEHRADQAAPMTTGDTNQR